MGTTDQEHPVFSTIQTFLIADLRGYTRFTLEHGDEAAAHLAMTFATLARATVQARGGQVVELRGDEVLAVFPSTRQALWAAIELEAGVAAARQTDPSFPPVGIGLDAGEAVPVEEGYRGAALNLAARLCSLAGPGEVLASETVIHLARKVHKLVYIERGAVQLKGFADPVRVVQVRAERPDTAGEASPHPAAAASISDGHSLREGVSWPIGGFLGALPDSPLVAREDELQQVLRMLDAVDAGTGRLVMLAGEPGVGKTRLAQEATLAARNCHWHLATGRCYEAQQKVAYYPFLEALPYVFQAASSSLQTEASRRWPDLTRLLPEWRVGAIEPPPEMRGYDDQQRLFWAVTGFVQELAREAPVMLALDDLQWADEASLGLFQHLARHTRGARVLLLGTYRDVEVNRQHPLEAALRTLGREHLIERIAVRRMPVEGTAALIAATLDQAASRDLADAIHQRTEGNPFFTQEVLRVLAARRDVYRAGGRWEQRTVADIAVPESIRSAIGERVARLNPTTQDVLSEASVLGQPFTFEDLRGVGGRDEAALEASLEEATKAGIVREAERAGYTFQHVLTQQALAAEIPLRRRQRLHRAAGEAIEREARSERRAAELVWHFLEGNVPERALPYALRAGDQAEAVYAHSEAEHHYQTALELAREVGDSSGEAQARERLGQVLSRLARYDEALEMLEAVAAYYDTVGDLDGVLRATALIGHVHIRQTTEPAGVERLAARLKALLARFSTPQMEARYARGLAMLWTALARLYTNSDRSQPLEGLAATERALELARAAADPSLIAQAEIRRGTACIDLGRYEEGIQAIEAALPTLEAEQDLAGLCVALANGSEAYFQRGELARVSQCLERGLDAAEQLGDPADRLVFLWRRGAHYYLLGKWQQARDELERALALSRELGVTYAVGNALSWLGVLSFFEGKPEAAQTYFSEAEAVVPEDVLSLDVMYWALAERDLLAGDPAAARMRLLAPMDRLGLVENDSWTWQRLLLAWALGELGETEEAWTMVNSLQPHASAELPRFARVEAVRIQLLLLAHQKVTSDGIEARLEQALAFCRSMPYPHQEVRLLHAAGRFLAEQGRQEQACQHFEAALAICEQIGEHFYAPCIERELAALVCS
ncbi:MAG TPA: AAA family ATPase [Ktedonobacterales bacterium]|nr:AAA family ATPase [Ktedonobacterales bacterium]